MQTESKPTRDYIDHQGHAKQLVEHLKTAEQGGAIGITGIRGVGKSALMAEVCQQLRDQEPSYHLVEMTAPSHYQQSMAFFMSVCSHLCHEVQRQAQRELYNDQPLKVQQQKANRWKKTILGMPVVVVFLALVFWVFLIFSMIDGPSGSQQELQDYKYHQWRLALIPKSAAQTSGAQLAAKSHVLYVSDQYQYRIVAHLKQQERQVVDDLIQQIDNLQLKSQSKSAMGSSEISEYLLTYGVAGVGFSLKPAQLAKDQQHQLSEYKLSQPAPQFVADDLAKIQEHLSHKLRPELQAFQVQLLAGESLTSETRPIEKSLWHYVRYVLLDGIEPEFIGRSIGRSIGQLVDDELAHMQQLFIFNRSEQPISPLNLLFSYQVIQRFEQHLMSSADQQQAAIRGLAQQLRVLLSINPESVAINLDGRPAHLLAGWLINQAVYGQPVKLSAPDLLRFKRLLSQYLTLLNKGYMPQKANDQVNKIQLWLSSFFPERYGSLMVIERLVILLVLCMMIFIKQLSLPSSLPSSLEPSLALALALSLSLLSLSSLSSLSLLSLALLSLFSLLLYSLLLQIIKNKSPQSPITNWINKNDNWLTSKLLKILPSQSVLKAQIAISGQFAELLHFQQEIQTSGELQLGHAKGSKSQLKQQRALNLPILTKEFAHYCRDLLESSQDKDQKPKIIIAIDELDKIHDVAQVKQLLSDIKGALALPQVYFLITIAEDCAESFYRRLAKGRDIFESSFDDLIYVKRLSAHGCDRLIGQLLRASPPLTDASVKMESPVRLLLFLMCGGVAREIQRSCRHVLSSAQVISAELVIQQELEQAWFEWSLELVNLPIETEKISRLYTNCHTSLSLLGNTNPISCAVLQQIKHTVTDSLAVFSLSELNKLIWHDQLEHLTEEQQAQQRRMRQDASGLASLVKLRLLIEISILQLADPAATEACGTDSYNDAPVTGGLENVKEMVIETIKLLHKQPLLANQLINQWSYSSDHQMVGGQ